MKFLNLSYVFSNYYLYSTGKYNNKETMATYYSMITKRNIYSICTSFSYNPLIFIVLDDLYKVIGDNNNDNVQINKECFMNVSFILLFLC